MQLEPADIKNKRRVGTLEGKDVIEVETTGGFHMLVVSKGAGMETLGTGPHKCVSRHIASKRFPRLQLHELAKGEYIEPSLFQHQLPKYEALTDLCNKLLR